MDAGRMLKLLEQVLNAHGASCTVEPALWRINAMLSHAGYAALGSGQPYKPAAQLELKAAGGSTGGAGMQAAGAEQQLKKPRGASVAVGQVSGSTGAPVPTAAASGALSIRLTVYQQQRGQYEVSATVPNTAGLTEATRFVALMHRVEADLLQMC